MKKRPGFWSALLHKQPIERGVSDPLELDLDRVRASVRKATGELSDSVNALLDDIQRRKDAKSKEGQRRV